MDYLITGLVTVIVFLGWAFYMRWKYSKVVKGKLMGEWWPESGMRYRELVTIEPNGLEIKAPKKQNQQCPRYFFNKQATWITRYPEAPIFNIRAIQVDVPVVSWPENNPEPINPYGVAPIASSTMLDSLRDNDFLAFAMAANEEIRELQLQLAKAYAERVPKNVMYLALVIAVAGAIAAAYLSYMNFDMLSFLVGG